MSEKKRILVVEDDEAIRHGTKLRLEMNAHYVHKSPRVFNELKEILDSLTTVLSMR